MKRITVHTKIYKSQYCRCWLRIVLGDREIILYIMFRNMFEPWKTQANNLRVVETAKFWFWISCIEKKFMHAVNIEFSTNYFNFLKYESWYFLVIDLMFTFMVRRTMWTLILFGSTTLLIVLVFMEEHIFISLNLLLTKYVKYVNVIVKC